MFTTNLRRRLILKNSCAHCGALGASDDLFGVNELREKCLIGKYTCLPKYLQRLSREREKGCEARKEISCRRERSKRGESKGTVCLGSKT